MHKVNLGLLAVLIYHFNLKLKYFNMLPDLIEIH